jgi:DNA-binding transcriptional MerR regulator
MSQPLLTAGRFAKLARTTKRTILWYEQVGILLPATIDGNGYRSYEPRQILDFQIISLLRQLDFSLDEIKAHVNDDQPLMNLFNTKEQDIAKQLQSLEQMLHDVRMYGGNLARSEYLIQPETRSVPGFSIYYIETTAPYADISKQCDKLATRFEQLPADAVFLTIFIDQNYSPQGAHMRIGTVKQPGMQLKAGVTDVHTADIPAYTAMTHQHRGDGSLLSLLWMEMGKYRREHGLEPAPQLDFYELEFYHEDNEGGGLMETEMHLPIRSL